MKKKPLVEWQSLPLDEPGGEPGDPLMREGTEGHDSSWLVSYSDLVTLLLGFFVMMFFFSSVDQKNMSSKVSQALQGSFGSLPSERLLHALQSMTSTPGLKIQPIERGIKATFISTSLFGSGSAELLAGAFTPMRKVLAEIKKAGGRPVIRVEGHTDDRPIQNSLYRSNWDLSSARAVTLVQWLEAEGFPAERMEAVGLGSSNPEVPNQDHQGNPLPENQTQNRRVVIKVLVDNG